MKFDYIIQNPPYKRSLHLEFFKKGLDLLSENGKMTIIEPATWLINVRKNGKAKLYDEIKSRLGKHVYKIIIENFNKEFNTGLYVPFSITYIDMNNEYDIIDFQCCGEYRKVDNLYDCNLIGSYDTIWSILNKVKKYGEKVGTMKDHIYIEGKTCMNKNIWYTKYADIIGIIGCGMFLGGGVEKNIKSAKPEIMFTRDIYFINNILSGYISCNYHITNNSIQQMPVYACKIGGIPGSHLLSDKIANNLFGTKQELENWKHFVFNNKLPLFISLVLTIAQHNNVKEFTPWLVDKHYTDEEIYSLLNITKDEQEFIDNTIKKYERYSPWFKRYMCGKDSVSSQDIQKFIDNL